MSKYSEALKEYNKGKDKWCIPKKGTDDHKIILRMMEKNNNIISSYPKSQKDPNVISSIVISPKKLKVKVPKEPKVKVPKVPKEPKVKVPKVPKVPKEPKIPKEPKVKETKAKVLNELSVLKVSGVPNVSKNNNIINFPISMKFLSDKKYSKSSVKSSQKTSRVFIKKLDNVKNANIIANFFKNKLIKDKYTLDNRVAFYNYINNLLVDINGDECLESKVFKSRKGFTINNKINLYKKIGTESAFGVIYLTSIVNSFGGFTIASKVMNDDFSNTNEIKIMKFITDEIILKKRSRHFVLMYKHAICKKIPFDDKYRIVCVNELAHGDLKTLMENEEILKDDELMINLLFQTYISIGTFHNTTGYAHRDAHHGNFLYQKNNEIGYYEYSFNGKSYYLKSCGYNIMIYDFGLSKSIKLMKNDDKFYNILIDYGRIIHAFLNKKYDGWIVNKKLPSKYVNDKLSIVKRLILKTETIININDRNIDNKFFEYIIEKIFMVHSPKGLWLTERPDNVINKKAFDIS